MTLVPDRYDRAWLWLGMIVVIGLVLRMAGAQGALWLDEAWSATLANDAGSPIGVFLNINHDNNHLLNSLWLQFLGDGASPMLARALSIVTGTLAIVAAAWVAAPRGPVAMLVTGWLFAVSPTLVTLGSEARGYAPMTLALLVAVALVDNQLAGSRFRAQAGLALCFFLGTLAQLTMVFGICAVIGWFAFATWRRQGLPSAATATLRLFAIPFVALLAALALVFVPAMLSKTGFQFGRYDPFDIMMYLHGIVEMVQYTVAMPFDTAWLIAGALMLLVAARPAGASKLAFYRLAIFAFPFSLAVLQAGNVAYPRYYLLAGVALLLLIGELVAIAWLAGKGPRLIGAAGLLAISFSALALDADLIRNQRGGAGGAVDAMRERAPAGTTIILDRAYGSAVIEQAAAYQRYPIKFQEAGCPPQRFILADRFGGERFPPTISRCGAHYIPIEGRRARGLSGTHWTLYERRR